MLKGCPQRADVTQNREHGRSSGSASWLGVRTGCCSPSGGSGMWWGSIDCGRAHNVTGVTARRCQPLTSNVTLRGGDGGGRAAAAAGSSACGVGRQCRIHSPGAGMFPSAPAPKVSLMPLEVTAWSPSSFTERGSEQEDAAPALPCSMLGARELPLRGDRDPTRAPSSHDSQSPVSSLPPVAVGFGGLG